MKPSDPMHPADLAIVIIGIIVAVALVALIHAGVL